MSEVFWFVFGFASCFLSLNAFLIAGIGYGMWREILEENKK